MKTIRALIVDDERLARAELRRLLAAHVQIEIVGEAVNAEQAHGMIADLQPDLLLLDIQMPGGSGFDLLGALNHAPKTIFTTAFDQYALRAFEVSALDYLLKPIDPKRLTAALARVDATQAAKNTSDMGNTGTIFIKDGNRCWFVELDKIMLFESEGNYTRVFFSSEQPLMLRSLLQLEQTLDPAKFWRANRKHIVNLAHVVRIDSADSGGLVLTLSNGTEVAVSRRRAAEFKTGMHLNSKQIDQARQIVTQ